jgi:DNA repair protein RadC
MTIMTNFYVREGSDFRPAADADVLQHAHVLIARRFRVGAPILSRPGQLREFLTLHLGPRDHEVFGLILLDNRKRLIAVNDLFRGTINLAAVYPREVIKLVLGHNAAAVILFHNHPSGLAEPSAADEWITTRIKEALSLVDVDVLDHLIVGEGVFSFVEHGLL